MRVDPPSCLSGLLAIALAATPAAAAEQLLYTFQGGTDGAYPKAGLLLAGDGTLYGTTYAGGTGGCGTVFKIAGGVKSTVHSFTCGPKGNTPYGGVAIDTHRNLYGTTEYGGTGFGVLYKITAKERFSVLHVFAGGADGAYPLAAPILDGGGNIYGTTAGLTDAGGIDDLGTIFEITAAGPYAVLYRFTGAGGGAYPVSALHRDSGGNLFGTSNCGGASSSGDVFKLTSGGVFTELHAFAGTGCGGIPGLLFGLAEDRKGRLTGTTYRGGGSNVGSVFRIAATGKETDLYSFLANGIDGRYPYGAGVIADQAGNFYGVTSGGGTGGLDGDGTVFRLSANGQESVLYNFQGGADGAGPWDVGSLAMDAAGRLYGTTVIGGAPGAGTVFEITP